MERIGTIRNKIAAEMGFLVPQVRLKDNLRLDPFRYSIQLGGNEVAQGEVYPNMLFVSGAIDPQALPESAMPAEAPGFASNGFWIPISESQQLQSQRVQLTQPAAVIARHLEFVANEHASELLTREQTSLLFKQLQKTHPAIVEELVPERLSLAQVQQVLQNLLAEEIPIRQLALICEALSDAAEKTSSPHILTQLTRERLARTISQRFSSHGEMQVVTLSPQLEERISNQIDTSGNEIQSRLAPSEVESICHEIRSHYQVGHQRPVLLARPKNRTAIRWLTQHRVPDLITLSHAEITLDTRVVSVGVIGASAAAA